MDNIFSATKRDQQKKITKLKRGFLFYREKGGKKEEFVKREFTLNKVFEAEKGTEKLVESRNAIKGFSFQVFFCICLFLTE